MRWSTTCILLIVVISLGAFIVLYEKGADSSVDRALISARAIAVDSDAVRKLDVIYPDRVFTFVKTMDGWNIESPIGGRAGNGVVERMLHGFEELPKDRVIVPEKNSNMAETLMGYGFDESSVRVMFDEGIRQTSYDIGRVSPAGDSLYIKKTTDGEHILVTTTNLLGLLPDNLNDIRDKALFALAPQMIKRLEIRGDEGFIRIQKNPDGVWMIQQPFIGRANDSYMRLFIDALVGLRIQEYVSDAVADWAAYGLDESDIRGEIIIGGEQLSSLRIGDTTSDTGLVYAAFQPSDAVFTLPKQVEAAFTLKAEDLRDRRLLYHRPDQVRSFKIEAPDGMLELARQTNGTWMIIQPRQWNGDMEGVTDWLTTWSSVKVDGFIDNVGTNLADYGLADPAYRVTFNIIDTKEADETVGSTSLVTIALSEPLSPEGHAMARVDNRPSICEISAGLLKSINPGPLYFRDRKVLSVSEDAIARIAIETTGTQTIVERNEDGVFAVSTPEAHTLNRESLVAMLDIFSDMRALSLLEVDPVDLSVYGLDNPSTVITLNLKGSSGLGKSIMFGHETPDEDVYAMVRGQDIVVLLDRKIKDILFSGLTNPEYNAEKAQISTEAEIQN